MLPAPLPAASWSDLLRTLGTLAPEAGRGGTRHLLRIPAVTRFLSDSGVNDALAGVLRPGCFPYRATFFDKTPEANWKVPWHQDLAVPVAERHDRPGWSGWSRKDGVLFAQPPAAILERVVAARIHLDDCPETNGPLRVLPGTHRRGRISEADIPAIAREVSAVSCACAAGDVLLLKPLLLHASSPATRPGHRRVLHVEYAPAGIEQGFTLARA